MPVITYGHSFRRLIRAFFYKRRTHGQTPYESHLVCGLVIVTDLAAGGLGVNGETSAFRKLTLPTVAKNAIVGFSLPI